MKLLASEYGHPRRERDGRQRHGLCRFSFWIGRTGTILTYTLILSLSLETVTAFVPYFSITAGRSRTAAKVPAGMMFKDLTLADADADSISKGSANCIPRHPLFRDANVVTREFPAPARGNPWEKIVPPADLFASLVGPLGGRTSTIKGGVIGKDVTVRFVEPKDGSEDLLRSCGLSPEDRDRERLLGVLSFYRDVVGPGREMKARIVSTRGHVGIKCPRWHIDHVPVRLVMSLVGPGCVYITGTSHGDTVAVNREALNNLDVDDTRKANTIIVPREEGAIHAKAGKAVLLMGTEWEVGCEHGQGWCEGKYHILAAAHKSPMLHTFEGRVLLVVDVAPNVTFS